jgi:hypothetical protein
MKLKNLNIKPLKLKAVFLFIALSLGWLVLHKAQTAQAQSSITLTAIPPRVEIKAKPGETVQETIKVRNDTDTEIPVTSEVIDFIVIDDKGTPLPVDEEVSGRWSLASWITIAPTKLILQPREVQPIYVVVTVPEDALPGGHYAMVLHQPLAEATIAQETGSMVAQKVGSLFFLTVEGPITEDAKARLIADKAFAEYGPINFTAIINNLSDVHIRPIASIEVKNMLNQMSSLINLEEYNIFPLKSRSYTASFPGKWHFGRYTATLTAAYGIQGNKAKAQVIFWIIPWKLILVIILLILVILITYYTVKKKKGPKPKSQGKDKTKQTKPKSKDQHAPPPIEVPELK